MKHGEIIAKVARKSLVTSRDLNAGERLTESDLTAKRPGTGIPALRFSSLVGRTLKRAINADVLLPEDDLI